VAAVGCTLAISGEHLDPSAVGGLAQAAEELGYDSVWVSDHVVIPERIASAYPYSPDGAFHSGPRTPVLEPLSSLAYLAGQTRRIRLGTHVLILPYRNPVLTAKMATTIDNLSGGRLDLGVGVGWMQEEFDALGQAEYYERRGAVSDEQMRVLRTLWTEDVPRFSGDFYRFEPLGARPHPVQKPHPPIWIGGHTPAALRRVGRYGDAWAMAGCPSAPGRRPTCRPRRSRPAWHVSARSQLRRAAIRRRFVWRSVRRSCWVRTRADRSTALRTTSAPTSSATSRSGWSASS
jgi:probable F420-dependent oxidoreductase